MKKPMLVASLLYCFTISFNAFSQNGTKNFTIEDVYKSRTFRPQGINELRSMSDGMHYTILSDDYTRVIKYSYKTGDSLMTLVDMKDAGNKDLNRIIDYEFSGDETKLLIQTSYEPIYRRSFKADYYIYSIKDKTFKPLSNNGMQQLATFSPDGKKVAFVRDNNLFVANLETGREIQVTSDGKFNEIINGAPDWVYEEEFEFNKAFSWSPDSRRLAFMKFDERGVKMFNMTMFQGAKPAIDENALYPSNSQFKYPKAGEDNSIVTVMVYDVISGNTIRVNVGAEKDQYIPRILFSNDPMMLAVLRLNRLQNKLDVLGVNAATGESRTIYTESNKCYIDEGNFDNIQFMPDGASFVITSEQDGWSHLYKCDYKSGLTTQITKGEFDVTAYYGFDAAKKVFYYQAAGVSPLQREVYSITADGQTAKVLTTTVGTNSAQFSKSFKYFIHSYSSATTPPVYTLRESSGKQIRVLEDNSELVKRLSGYKFNYRKFFTITTKDGVHLNAYAIYPPNFNESIKYPVIMDQYSGPNSQQVLDSWGNFDFDDCMAQQGFIIVCVDPRGTGARGEAFRKVTYMELGKFETIDQVESARYLSSLPYVDGNKIGIWGWSYGGFISSSCMLKGDGVFAAGVAVAPVTNWRYYDNIYTERFMRTPKENPNGYDQNSPLFFADKLKGDLLLIHGTADDNVHVQNTLELSERLVQANKKFDMMVYTNRNHSIYGGNTRIHLFTKIADFFIEKMKVENEPMLNN